MEKAKDEIRVSAIIIPNPKIDSVNIAVPDHSHVPLRWRRFSAANTSNKTPSKERIENDRFAFMGGPC